MPKKITLRCLQSSALLLLTVWNLVLPRALWAEMVTKDIPAMRDTWISERQESVEFGEETTLKVGATPSTSTAEADKTAALLYFDLSTLPEEAVIESAKVEVWAESIQIERDTAIHLAALSADWNESDTAESLSLSPFPTSLTPLSLRTLTTANATDLANNWIAFDSTPELKALVQEWYDGDRDNHGFVIYTTDRSNAHTILLTSQDSATAAHHPLLKLSVNQPDKTAPVIESLELGTNDAGEVVVTWSTTEQSSSYVSYGLTDEYGTSFGQDALTTTHRVVIKSLERGREYHFQARSVDESGNAGLSEDKTYQIAEPEGDPPPEPEPVTEAPPSAVSTPISTPVEGQNQPTTPVNERKDKLNNPAAALSLAENADEYEPQSTELDGTTKAVLIVIACVLGLGTLLFIVRHQITAYLGTPVEEIQNTPPSLTPDQAPNASSSTIAPPVAQFVTPQVPTDKPRPQAVRSRPVPPVLDLSKSKKGPQ